MCPPLPPYSSVNGTDLGPGSGSCSASNGVDGQVTSSTSCSPALSHVVNGEATPNSTPVHQPSGSDTESRTGDYFFFFCISEWLPDTHRPPLKTFKCYKTLQIYTRVQEVLGVHFNAFSVLTCIQCFSCSQWRVL